MNMHETGERMPCKAVKFQTVNCFWNSISGEFARGVASDAGSPLSWNCPWGQLAPDPGVTLERNLSLPNPLPGPSGASWRKAESTSRQP